MDIKNLDFNNQILIVNSSLLGDAAKDNNSFTQRLLRWIISFCTLYLLSKVGGSIYLQIYVQKTFRIKAIHLRLQAVFSCIYQPFVIWTPICLYQGNNTKIRETEDTLIKIPDLMHLKIELEGGFKTDPKYLLFIRTVKVLQCKTQPFYGFQSFRMQSFPGFQSCKNSL